MLMGPISHTIPQYVAKALEPDEWIVGDGTPGVGVSEMPGVTLMSAAASDKRAGIRVVIEYGRLLITTTQMPRRIEK